ncbi:MAG: alpha/beta hydrolase [Candidatus Aminicenantes bacterium]|nr:MAG: alpha/beta hydrolase [Candidatus Aminicenantes bacterium]
MENRSKRLSIIGAALIICAVCLFNLCSKPEQKVEKSPPVDIETLKSRLVIQTEVDSESNTKVSRGTFSVFEDRKAQEGRMIKLDVVVLHATGSDPKPDPIFPLSGGPGEDATKGTMMYKESRMRGERDIVLVSQRGTGGDNKLDCELPANDSNIQGYLDPLFDAEAFRACLEELKKNFDLTKYSTSMAADDLNEVRLALGYDKINVIGGSYGTRAALVYMRRHPETVRTAILTGIAPIAFKNPLFHAPAAQEAIRLLFAECANDPDCHAAFPNLEDEFQIIIERLENEPAEVTITHPVTKERVPVKLSRAAFAEAVRTMMYSMSYNRRIPYLIHRAFEGDYEPFAQLGMQSNRGILRHLAVGMLLCVTCAEDLARISEEEIVEITGGTFLGDGRVRRQKATCEFWPKSDIPRNYGDPVSVDVHVLLFSGTLDPVTPPRWGKEAASHLPNSLHLVVPGVHGLGGECIRTIQQQFLETGSVRNLDVSCTESMKMPPFRITE